MALQRNNAQLQLLGWILRGEVGEVPSAIRRTLNPQRVREHRLAPWAHHLGIQGFRDDFIHCALAAELWKQALDEVLGAFDAAGIEACRLKGCAYFLDRYEDPALRPMGDLDLLVRPERFDDAGRVLRDLGFSTRTTKDFVYAPSHHALTYDRRSITVDLHRNMMQEGRSKIDLPGLWKRADTAEHRPEALDEIVLHLCHMIRSELMVPLATFVDLGLLLRQGAFSRDTILARCDAYRVGRGARIVLGMYDVLVGGHGGRSAPFPLPSAEELAGAQNLSRSRRLLMKAMLVDGPGELAGLALTTLRERSRRWR